MSEKIRRIRRSRDDDSEDYDIVGRPRFAGLFHEPDAVALGNQALNALRNAAEQKVFGDKISDIIFSSEDLGESIERIASRYHHNAVLLQPITPRGVKERLEAVSNATIPLVNALSKLPSYAVNIIEIEASRRGGVLSVSKLKSDIGFLKDISSYTAGGFKNKRGRPRNITLAKAVQSLIEIWTKSFEETFKSNFATSPGVRHNAEFATSEGRFVQVILQAIDPSITVDAIRGCLEKALSQRSSKPKKVADEHLQPLAKSKKQGGTS